MMADEETDVDADLINLGFSPDGKYFAAGARTIAFNALGGVSAETSAIAVDLATRQTVSLRGPLKKLISGGFTFAGPDRIIGLDAGQSGKAALVTFPAGEVVDQLPPVGLGKIAAVTRGNYLLIRPISKYAVGVMDIATKKIFMANKQSAFDIYDRVYASERINGELGLYDLEKGEMQAKVLLPRSPLGRIHAVALSPDFKWLAVSGRTRGAVWSLSKGERLHHVRGFRGAHFAEDNALYGDFPKLDQVERQIARLDLANRQVSEGPHIEGRVKQNGNFVVYTRPGKKEDEYDRDVTIEVRDARTLTSLWSKRFPKEAPRVWVDPAEATMAMSWPISSDAAKAEIKGDAALASRLAAMKEKEGDYFLQVLDARTGNAVGRLLIETGKGSFRISHVFAAGDWVVISDSENRVLVYSISTGEQKGKTFGGSAAVSRASKLLCVENERGQLTVYDMGSMEKRDQLSFSSPVSLTRFSDDGKSLFVLTASQMAYVIDVSSLAR
jgi:hypothetical protein